MNSDWAVFLLGVLFSIPIAIGGSLAARPIERWWGSRNEQKATQLAARDRVLRERAARFGSDRESFDLWLWTQAISVLRLLVFAVCTPVLFGLVAAMGFAVWPLAQFPSTGQALFFMAAFFTAGIVIVCFRLGIGATRDAGQMIYLVNSQPEVDASLTVTDKTKEPPAEARD